MNDLLTKKASALHLAMRPELVLRFSRLEAFPVSYLRQNFITCRLGRKELVNLFPNHPQRGKVIPKKQMLSASTAHISRDYLVIGRLLDH
jgi:hypothetical protein